MFFFQIPATLPIFCHDLKIHLMTSTLRSSDFKALQDLGGFKDLKVVLLSHLLGELMNFVEEE